MDSKTFCNPGPQWRDVALWMLNDILEPDELIRQLDGMKNAGWGAAITRTFNGLRTKYLSDEYMEATQCMVDHAEKIGMKIWLQAGYMPGCIPSLEDEHTLRVLLRKPKDAPTARTEKILLTDDNYRYSAELLESVLDLLTPSTADDYLEKAYRQPWADRFAHRFGKTVEAVWVDEPHFLPPSLPWSDQLQERFQDKWGYDLVENLPLIFTPAGDYRAVRHHYFRVLLEMFLEGYFARIGRWCKQNNVKFTGHLMGEDTLNNQIGFTLAAMPCYQYMDIPGIDHLTRSLKWPAQRDFILTPKQCTSVANQYGKEAALAEIYGVSSQGITFQDRKMIGDWMAVLGINYRCIHGSFYSMRGRRKRFYVPHLSYQQPWWNDNRLIADYFARLSYAMRQGKSTAEILVLHPVESAFSIYDITAMDRPYDRSTEPLYMKQYSADLTHLCRNLMEIQRTFDFGDETIMAQIGEVSDDNALRVGEMSYKAVILPDLITIRRTTLELLKKFAAAGGRIFTVGALPDRIDGRLDESATADLRKIVTLVENTAGDLRRTLKAALPPLVELLPTGDTPAAGDIWINTRRTDDGTTCFLTNISTADTVTVQLRMQGSGRLEAWDTMTGNVTYPPQHSRDGRIFCDLTFAPLQSHLLLLNEKQEPQQISAAPQKLLCRYDLSDRMKFQRHAPNAMTLDKCRYRKADGPWSELLPVIYVQETLTNEQYAGPITLEFKFNAAFKPAKLAAVIEDAAQYRITVNGQAVQYQGLPYYIDRAFHPVDIAAMVGEGENTIEMSIDYKPLPKPKFMLAALFDSMVGTELESIYLIGDFAVRGKLSAAEAKPKCIRYQPAFTIAAEAASPGHDLAADGYPFYAGRITLADTVRIDQPLADGQRAVLHCDELHAVLAKVKINGRDAGALTCKPYELDVTDFVAEGDNKVEIELVSGLRNLLGPHHRSNGEPDDAWKTAFDYRVDSSTGDHAEELDTFWTDDYFVTNFGLGSNAAISVFDSSTDA